MSATNPCLRTAVPEQAPASMPSAADVQPYLGEGPATAAAGIAHQNTAPMPTCVRAAGSASTGLCSCCLYAPPPRCHTSSFLRVHPMPTADHVFHLRQLIRYPQLALYCVSLLHTLLLLLLAPGVLTVGSTL